MRNKVILTSPELQPGNELLAEGRRMEEDWRLGSCLFLETETVASEAEYKRRMAATGRMMQHAHIGFRNLDRTVDAMAHLHEAAGKNNVRIDRFGITLDWSMGYPPNLRKDAKRGTGIVLNGPDDFQKLTNASPAATHFGDFMLGLPGALDNVQAAIAAGVTAIGNLGQYFTFRLPHWNDDVATTRATVKALGLIAAQKQEILVHSNLDDGFAGLFVDMTSAFGMMLLEKHIMEDLIGVRASFCFGHHFSAPLTRMAFHQALAHEVQTPGTMLFGNTVAYQGNPAANFASLANYLMADIAAMMRQHTGHAINPVPVTENMRIPDVDEILDAQTFAARLVEHANGHEEIVDNRVVDTVATKLRVGGRKFADRALAGLAEREVDITDPAALMLAIRRLGAKQMETLWGNQRHAEPDIGLLVPADWAVKLDETADHWLEHNARNLETLKKLNVVIGTTDVHEHGAYLISRALEGLNANVIDAGVAIDPDELVARSIEVQADVIAISTYNGIALDYANAVVTELDKHVQSTKVIIGGKLNQIPDSSNTDLPVDVTKQLSQLGIIPCSDLDEMLDALQGFIND